VQTLATLSACFLVAWMAGCGPPEIQFAPGAQPPRALQPRDASTVEVSTIPPGRPYVQIGTLSIMHYTVGATDPVALLRQDAAKRGCDDIVVQETRDWFTAVCLVYTTK